MKKIIRTISILLVFAITCSLFSLNAFAEAEEINLEDAKLMYGLNITGVEPIESNMKLVYTRAEFLSVLMSFEKGLSYNSDEQHFTDVPSDHAYAGVVNKAYELGIITGDGNGEFKPENPITYAQAVVMILRYLGYDSVAKERGGYFVGYAAIASQVNLTKGMSCSENDILRYKDVCKLLANALDVKVVIFKGVSDGNVISGTEEGKTLLTEKLKLKRGHGVVKGNENTMLPSSSTTKKKSVLIENKTYSVGTSGADRYLGYTVDYYYDISDEFALENTLVYVTPSGLNTTITVNSGDILVGSGLSETVFPYSNENGKIKKAKISPYADLVYNGVSVGANKLPYMTPDNGNVTLIDNDDDGAYDLLVVKNYETIVVGATSSASSVVYDYYDGRIHADLDAADGDTVVIYNETDQLKFNSIRNMNVLSVAASVAGGKKHTEVLVSTNSVLGTYVGLSGDKITIDDTVYEIVPGTTKVYKDGNPTNTSPSNIEEVSTWDKLKDLTIGASGRFYLDSFGRVAGYMPDDAAAKKYMYGYLIAAGLTKGIDPKLQIKVMTEAGVKIYDGAEKILVDNVSETNMSNILSLLSAAAPARETGYAGTVYAQLIRYSLNRNNEITLIDTNNGDHSGDNEDDKLYLEIAKGERKYMRPSRSLGTTDAEIALNEDTVVFKLPAVGREGEEDEYYVGSVGKDGNGCEDILYPSGDHTVEGYTLNDVRVAESVIVHVAGASNSYSAQSGVGLITSLYEALDEEGNNTYKVVVAETGRLNEYILQEAEIKPAGMKIGDVIVFNKSGNNIITALEIATDLTATTSKGYGNYNTYFYSNIGVLYGYIYNKIGMQISATTAAPSGGTATGLRPFDLANLTTQVVVFDKSSGKYEFAPVSELSTCVWANGAVDKKVVIITRSSEVKDAYIIEE